MNWWIVWDADGWGAPVQAETRGKAKVAYMGDNRDYDFTKLRCRKATQQDLIYIDAGGTDFWHGMAGWGYPLEEWFM
jgi:hypothetical protein